MADFPVIYLTGAPAAGKTTLTNHLKDLYPNLHIFHYGEELTGYLNKKNGEKITQVDLRRQSATKATPEDIDALDAILIDLVEKERSQRPIIIDSHAVTKESYGFRVTPFSIEKLHRLRPTHFVVLYTSPNTTITRIKNHSAGRPVISEFESIMHSSLQGSVAITYAINSGLPTYFLDSEKDADTLVAWFEGRISR